MRHILEDGSTESGGYRTIVHHAPTGLNACICQSGLGSTMRMTLMYGSCKPYQSGRL